MVPINKNTNLIFFFNFNFKPYTIKNLVFFRSKSFTNQNWKKPNSNINSNQLVWIQFKTLDKCTLRISYKTSDIGKYFMAPVAWMSNFFYVCEFHCIYFDCDDYIFYKYPL